MAQASRPRIQRPWSQETNSPFQFSPSLFPPTFQSWTYFSRLPPCPLLEMLMLLEFLSLHIYTVMYLHWLRLPTGGVFVRAAINAVVAQTNLFSGSVFTVAPWGQGLHLPGLHYLPWAYVPYSAPLPTWSPPQRVQCGFSLLAGPPRRFTAIGRLQQHSGSTARCWSVFYIFNLYI